MRKVLLVPVLESPEINVMVMKCIPCETDPNLKQQLFLQSSDHKLQQAGFKKKFVLISLTKKTKQLINKNSKKPSLHIEVK